MQQGADGRGQGQGAEDDAFEVVLAALTAQIRGACGAHREWPAQVGAGVYGGIAYLVERPVQARQLLASPRSGPMGEPFRKLVKTMSELLAKSVPATPEQDAAIPTATMAGIWLLVGEHLRVDRPDRLLALRPDLHLMILLPYLGFEDARRSVSSFQTSMSS